MCPWHSPRPRLTLDTPWPWPAGSPGGHCSCGWPEPPLGAEPTGPVEAAVGPLPSASHIPFQGTRYTTTSVLTPLNSFQPYRPQGMRFPELGSAVAQVRMWLSVKCPFSQNAPLLLWSACWPCLFSLRFALGPIPCSMSSALFPGVSSPSVLQKCFVKHRGT